MSGWEKAIAAAIQVLWARYRQEALGVPLSSRFPARGQGVALGLCLSSLRGQVGEGGVGKGGGGRGRGRGVGGFGVGKGAPSVRQRFSGVVCHGSDPLHLLMQISRDGKFSAWHDFPRFVFGTSFGKVPPSLPTCMNSLPSFACFVRRVSL